MMFLRKLWRCSSWFSWLCIAIVIGFSIYAFSNAEVTFDDFGIALVVFSAWGILWLFRLLIWLAIRKTGRARKFENPRLAWSLEPITCAVLIGIISIHGFMYCRFFLGLPWLHRFAVEKLTFTKPTDPSGWSWFQRADEGQKWLPCGLYQIGKWQITTTEDGGREIYIITADHTLTDAAGFVYVPSGKEPSGRYLGCGPSYFDHLIGPWWRWRWDI